MMLLCAALVLAQPRSVTFTHPCAHSSVVLEALGKELGVKMAPGGSVKQDYVLIKFDDVPVEEALKKLADTLNATWVQTNGAYALTRTPAQERAELEREAAGRRKYVQQWLDANKVEGQVTIEGSLKVIEQVMTLTGSRPDNPGNPEDYDKRYQLERMGPLKRYMVRLLNEIGADAVSAVKEGSRIVYVDRPRPGEQRLPNGESARMFPVETAIYKEALARSGALQRFVSAGTIYTYLLQPYLDTHGNTSVFETRLTIEGGKDSFSLSLEVPGHGSFNDSIYFGMLDRPSVPTELTGLTALFQADPRTLELAKAAKAVFDGRGEVVTVSPEAVAMLSDPEANEPLSFAFTDWTLQTAEALGKSVIAVVSDEFAYMPLFTLATGGSDLGSLWKMLPNVTRGFESKLEGDWLTIVPKYPGTVRSQRIERSAWRQAIARAPKGDDWTFETLGAFAALNDDDRAVMYAMLPVFIKGEGGKFDIPARMSDFDVLRLFGRLTAADQKRARNGGVELLTSRMAPDLLSVSRVIADKNARFLRPKRSPIDWGYPNMVIFDGTETDAFPVLARGFPPASVVRVYVLRRETLVNKEDPDSSSFALLPNDVGFQIASSEVWPEQYQGYQKLFAVASSEQLLIEIELTNNGFMYDRIQFDQLAKDAAYLPVERLPAAIRAEVEASLKRGRENLKNARNGGGGQVPGSPPACLVP